MGDAAVYDLATVVAERDALTQKLKASEAEVARLTDVLLSKHGGEPLTLMDELDEAMAEVALRKSEVELFRDKLKARCDEVAALRSKLQEDAVDSLTKEILAEETIASLRAACAAKDAALAAAIMCDGGTTHDGPDDEVGSRSCCYEISYKPHAADCWVLQAKAALSDTAGTNWVDATGAVEAIADHGCIDGSGVLVAANVPDDWAGRTVLVMVKP